MRLIYSATSFLALLAVSCAGPIAAQQVQTPASESSIKCNPEEAGALIARSTGTADKPNHSVEAATLRLIEAKYVQGPCADDLEFFVSGHAFLPSGKIFLIRDDGSVKLYPPQGLRERPSVLPQKVPGLTGYELATHEPVRIWMTPAGKRESDVGLFKGKSDFLIAKFDMLNGKPIRQTEILIRSRLPITALDYLPAPDAPQGRIGFVQLNGPDKAWLYTYDWDHGETGRER